MVRAHKFFLLFLLALTAFHSFFLGQAFHIDDANFLILSRGVSEDFWHPHNTLINWLGTEQRAFDVLSNPPGIAYVLYLGRLFDWQEPGHHLLVLPFTITTAIATYSLARRFTQHALSATILINISPAIVVSAHTVMPDLPLLACLLSGLAITLHALDRSHLPWASLGAFIMGTAAWFRYSALTGPPLLLLYLLLHRKRHRLSPQAILGLFALSLCPWLGMAGHELVGYNQVHFLHMIQFQGAEQAPYKAVYQGFAQLSLLGGTLCLPLAPLLLWSEKRRWPYLVLGITSLSGCLFLIQTGYLTTQESLYFCPMFASGLCILAIASGKIRGLLRTVRFGRGGELAEHYFIALWFMGMLIFNQNLRFAAVRYLLLAIPPAVFLLWRQAEKSPWKTRSIQGIIALSALLSLALAHGDYQIAGSYRQFATQQLPEKYNGKAIAFVGHWGLQHYLEAQGGTALSSSAPPPKNETMLIIPQMPWPQELPPGTKTTRVLESYDLESSSPFRTISAQPASCFYANAVATTSILEPNTARGPLPPDDSRLSFLPWTLSWGPVDQITVTTLVPAID